MNIVKDNNKKLLKSLILSGLSLFLYQSALAEEKHDYGKEINSKPEIIDTYKEKDYLSNIKQLTFEGEKSGEAYYSPDGKKIIFQSIRNKSKFYQIYTMNSDGSNQKMVSTGKGKTTCSYFSPNEDKIIYSSSHLDPKSEIEKPKTGKYSWDFEESMDIFKSNPDGSNLERLTSSEGYDAEGTYSSNGNKIVFTSNRDKDLELYVMNSDGSEQKRLTNRQGYDGGAFFSPDDSKIVFRRFDNRGNAQVVLMNEDGTNEKELTNTKAINWCPYFHPSGKYIIFSSNMNNRKNFELFIMDIDGNNLNQLTFNEGADVLPVFSPDGKKLMWTSTRSDGKSQIFTADFNDDFLYKNNLNSEKIFNDLKTLSSDEFEGRRTGTEGAEKAGEYIKGNFRNIGLLPGGDNKISYFQKFDVITGINLGNNNNFLMKTKNKGNISYNLNNTYIPLSFSSNGKVEGKLVFAGYGITANEYNYDDYSNIDVNDKIVVLLRHEPQTKNEKSLFNGNKPTPYSELRYKAFNAKAHGAKGIILVNGMENYTKDTLISLNTYSITGDVGIPVIQIKQDILDSLLNNQIKLSQKKIDHTSKPNSFLIEKLSTVIQTDLIRNKKPSFNVIGYIEGTDEKLKDEFIILGAHYDHLGFGGAESLSESKKALIHNGADDNASGVSALIELARRFSKTPPKRSIAFIAFSGEELGLVGSSHFTKNPTLKNIIAMLNMDMIGRLENNKLFVGGIKTSDIFENIVTDVNKEYNFSLRYFNDGYGPSDHMSFYLKDIPVLFFFTGVHSDYHKPSDDYYKINYSGLEKIVGFVENITNNLVNNEPKPKLVKLKRDPHSSTSLINESVNKGAYMGTIPDYAAVNSVNGVKLSGVKEGGPSDKAGLKAGDIIIKFDNIKINNLYDYTYAIRSKKPGDKIKITVKRNNKTLVFNVIAGKK